MAIGSPDSCPFTYCATPPPCTVSVAAAAPRPGPKVALLERSNVGSGPTEPPPRCASAGLQSRNPEMRMARRMVDNVTNRMGCDFTHKTRRRSAPSSQSSNSQPSNMHRGSTLQRWVTKIRTNPIPVPGGLGFMQARRLTAPRTPAARRNQETKNGSQPSPFETLESRPRLALGGAGVHPKPLKLDPRLQVRVDLPLKFSRRSRLAGTAAMLSTAGGGGGALGRQRFAAATDPFRRWSRNAQVRLPPGRCSRPSRSTGLN